MILDKLFNKKKSEQYFFEVGDDASKKTEAKPKPEVTETKKLKEAKAEQAQVESTQPQAKAKTEASSAPVTPSTPTTPNVSYELPQWEKAIKNYSQPESFGIGVSGTGNNFAGKYVSNNVSPSRRRPGPSLNKFKDIASKMSK